jgi:hypothetical protein
LHKAYIINRFMAKTLEERKQEVVDWCKIEYLDKSKQWWKTHKTVYKATKELVPDLENFVQTSNSFFIKKDYHMQLLGFAFALIFGLIVLKSIFEEAHFLIFLASILIFLIILISLYFSIKDKTAKVVLTKDCFWFYKMERHIPWQFLAASFVKENHRGDDVIFYFVLHYYNEKLDTFDKFEYIYSGLKMEIDDICFHIEKFKEKNIKPSSQISTP